MIFIGFQLRRVKMNKCIIYFRISRFKNRLPYCINYKRLLSVGSLIKMNGFYLNAKLFLSNYITKYQSFLQTTTLFFFHHWDIILFKKQFFSLYEQIHMSKNLKMNLSFCILSNLSEFLITILN